MPWRGLGPINTPYQQLLTFYLVGAVLFLRINEIHQNCSENLSASLARSPSCVSLMNLEGEEEKSCRSKTKG